jgi:hypothetical protein
VKINNKRMYERIGREGKGGKGKELMGLELYNEIHSEKGGNMR